LLLETGALSLTFYDENGEIINPNEGKEGAPPVDVPTGTILSLAAGNGLSVLVGGFGGCGLVPQTVLNLNSGGGGQISTGSYAASMILFAIVLAPLVGQISVPALAGIMVAVSLDTIQWQPTYDTVKAAFDDEEGARIRFGILIITGLLCYNVDFAVGITTGVVLDLIRTGKIGGTGTAAAAALMGSLGSRCPLPTDASTSQPALAAGRNAMSAKQVVALLTSALLVDISQFAATLTVVDALERSTGSSTR